MKKKHQPKQKPNAKRPTNAPAKPGKRPLEDWEQKKKNGRPEIEIDLARVRDLCRFMFADYELAVALGVSYATFKNKKAANPAIIEAMEDGYAMGKKGLRSMQFSVAMKGNVAMLIWLGKQYLDQKDKSLHGNDPDAPFVPENPDKLTRDELVARIKERTDRLGITATLERPVVAGISRSGLEAITGATDPCPTK